MEQSHEHLLSLAAKIVSAHVGNHATETAALPDLIREVYRTLAEVEPEAAALRAPVPAAGIAMRPALTAKAVAPKDQLTCLDCGMTMKMLKRHLITVHGLTPDEYRAKWNLPSDYPMVTSDYAELRSTLAKQSGLGKRPEAKGKGGRGRGR